MCTIKNTLTIGFSLLAFLLNSGCMSAAHHQKTLSSTQEREMTLGIVQKEIRTGMSQADVASALGSPNIVTRDSSGKETWVYDKVATEASYSKSHGYGTILILGFSKDAGAVSTTQKTLTVVIKFNEKNLVESFSYHTSKF
ncbi:outer membrane protein assembly factor BamE [uncultured Anoxybacillus sp.]|uniref:outer membrane protein assembly factor BamE domain-containing protein n=1 Tax=uncultured Anoxybacillus sp. TaxID=263860 RepID=UPI0026081DDD|nr:outer membrane protein assembly factor BamE [uncultured Anoxybacillus sp.]